MKRSIKKIGSIEKVTFTNPTPTNSEVRLISPMDVERQNRLYLANWRDRRKRKRQTPGSFEGEIFVGVDDENYGGTIRPLPIPF